MKMSVQNDDELETLRQELDAAKTRAIASCCVERDIAAEWGHRCPETASRRCAPMQASHLLSAVIHKRPKQAGVRSSRQETRPLCDVFLLVAGDQIEPCTEVCGPANLFAGILLQ